MKKKYIFFIVTINIIIFVTCILAIECASRIFSPRDIKSLFFDPNLRISGRPFIEPNPNRGFSLKPNFKNKLYHINSKGFRGCEFPDDLNDNFVIVTLGESTTFGWLVGENETYPHYLNQILDYKKYLNVYVINAGILSYSSNQVKIYLKELITKINPNFIIINILWNDIWYSTLMNWYPEILIYQSPRKWQRFLLKHSNFYRSLFLPNEPQKNNLINIINYKALNQYRKNIKEMIEICNKTEIQLAFIIPPFDENHFPEKGINPFNQVRLTKSFFIKLSKKYIEELEMNSFKYEIPIIDHSLSLNSKKKKQDLFLDCVHPNPQGNLIMALDIVNFIIKHNLIKR